VHFSTGHTAHPNTCTAEPQHTHAPDDPNTERKPSITSTAAVHRGSHGQDSPGVKTLKLKEGSHRATQPPVPTPIRSPTLGLSRSYPLLPPRAAAGADAAASAPPPAKVRCFRLPLALIQYLSIKHQRGSVCSRSDWICAFTGLGGCPRLPRIWFARCDSSGWDRFVIESGRGAYAVFCVACMLVLSSGFSYERYLRYHMRGRLCLVPVSS
jgi:hypothetical protein